MRAIEIKVLKDNLSKYLRLVRSGEIVLVTDRDEVIAEIHQPTIPMPGKLSAWDAFLNDESRKGKIRRAVDGLPPPFSLLGRQAQDGSIDIGKLMDDVRSDRDLLGHQFSDRRGAGAASRGGL